MEAEALLRKGELDEAVRALSESLRDHPEDQRSRTFLFELLCFQGDYDRAGKHLTLLAGTSSEAAAGALLYAGALHAEETRKAMFEKEDYPASLPGDAALTGGVWNGKAFSSLSDADPRLGPRLEVFAAGEYMWLPFRHIASLEVRPPERLRDLLWARASVRMRSGHDQRELGELLLPALTPLTFQHPDGAVRLGRVTEWCRDEQGRENPYGAKMLLIDGEEVPLLELRKLEMAEPSGAAAG